MGLAEDFGRLRVAAKALEQVHREGKSPEEIADSFRLYAETLDTALRSLATAQRRLEVKIDRQADNNWEVISAEVEPLRDRQNELSALLYEMRREPSGDDAPFDAPGD